MNTETQTTQDFTKVCRLGSSRETGSAYVNIKYKAGKLSIAGVEGPNGSGNCMGSCGQISVRPYTEAGSVFDFAHGWDAAKVLHLADLWDEWHLNDMQAGCEHQRAEWDTTEKIEVVTYGITSEAHDLRRKALQEAEDAALAGRVANLTETGKALIGPDWFKDKYEAPDADSPLSSLYEVSKRETKAAGWVREDEHPKGLLSKPCGTCGYKYGTKWLKVDVPASVLEWLQALPDTDKTPAWV